jgi:pyridoxamine 5'-phosphate oxidase
MNTIADIRKDYRLKTLSEEEVQPNPFAQFEVWWQEALAAKIEEVNAMTLSTASADGVPAGRIVLLKGYNEKGFVFFTNYQSFKGNHLAENPRASLLFFWKELERQVRITGISQQLSAAENDEYYNSRPAGSRIGAWASPQWLEARVDAITKEFEGKNIARPQHWGGYCVKPVSIEFWQGRSSRLHDRIQYALQPNGLWAIERLAP